MCVCAFIQQRIFKLRRYNYHHGRRYNLRHTNVEVDFHRRLRSVCTVDLLLLLLLLLRVFRTMLSNVLLLLFESTNVLPAIAPVTANSSDFGITRATRSYHFQ